MVPIAKAALVTLLLGCGATGTFALANGGFGIGTATENGNEHSSDVTPASPEVANAAGGNTQEAVPVAGTIENQVQVNQEESPVPNVRDDGTREEKAAKDETVNQPQTQDDTPPSVGADGLQETQSLAEGQKGKEVSDPVAPGDPGTSNRNEVEASLKSGHQNTKVKGDVGEDTTVQQQENGAQREQETAGGKQSQGPTQELAGQTSEEGAKVANKESDGSLQVGDASLPDGQLTQVPGQAPEQGQISSGPAEGSEQANVLDSGSSSDSQKNGVDTTISSEGQN